jgi:hypothetical protein
VPAVCDRPATGLDPGIARMCPRACLLHVDEDASVNPKASTADTSLDTNKHHVPIAIG